MNNDKRDMQIGDADGLDEKRIHDWQTALWAIGFRSGPSGVLSTDGDYGPVTKECTQALQRSKGLIDTGIAGAATLSLAALDLADLAGRLIAG